MNERFSALSAPLKQALVQHLAIPYILEVESVEQEGGWVRRVSYPELPDCTVEREALLEGLRELEVKKAVTIVRLLQTGQPVPQPRPALASFDGDAALRALQTE